MLMNNASGKIDAFCDEVLNEYKDFVELFSAGEKFVEKVKVLNRKYSVAKLYYSARKWKEIVDQSKAKGVEEAGLTTSIKNMLACVLAIKSYEKLPEDLALDAENGYEQGHPIRIQEASSKEKEEEQMGR